MLPCSPVLSHSRFSRLISTFNLIDTWRHKFPLTRAYSCFSTSHNTMSRIDLILITAALAPRLITAEFYPRLLSDHSPYWVTLSIPIDKPPPLWRLNPFWLSLLSEDDELIHSWTNFFTENAGSASPDMVWESFKLHARMILTSRINRFKADSIAVLDGPLSDLSTSEQLYVADPSSARADHLRLQNRVIDQLQYEAARRKLFFAKQKLFEHGEKAGKLLACLVHSKDKPPTVISLTGPDGGKITDPQAVTNRFRDFFSQLYTSHSLSDLSRGGVSGRAAERTCGS